VTGEQQTTCPKRVWNGHRPDLESTISIMPDLPHAWNALLVKIRSEPSFADFEKENNLFRADFNVM
jgi:hypothetical protein